MGDAVERGDESLFRGNAGSLKLYRLVRGYITNLGAVDIVPRKTQVGFRHGRYFAWVWLPQMWIRHQPRESITLSFGLDRRVRDHRIRESVEPYPGRFTHHVVILKTSDFDPKVRAWVGEAFELAGRRS